MSSNHLTPTSVAFCIECSREVVGDHICEPVQPMTRFSALERLVFDLQRRELIRRMARGR